MLLSWWRFYSNEREFLYLIQDSNGPAAEWPVYDDTPWPLVMALLLGADLLARSFG